VGFVVEKWHWDSFFPEYLGFSLSVSFHQCSITRKNEKKVIFITALHNKPQGCGASVASAAGPFTTKKKRILRHCTPNFIAVFATANLSTSDIALCSYRRKFT
jgi:hypothetical protein